MCSFREDSRKRRAPKFTVEAQYQMKDCPVKATIQQLVNRNNTFEDFLTITFRGNIFINQVTFNRDELLTKKKRIYIKHFKKI